MSDLNDDLLNYESGDELDDHALYGEDELLLSDEELEKDVTKEAKRQIKAEAEQWVNAQIQENHSKSLRDAGPKSNVTGEISATSNAAPVSCLEASEVTSTAVAPTAPLAGKHGSSDGNTTSANLTQKKNDFKEPSQAQQSQHPQTSRMPLLPSPTLHGLEAGISHMDEVTSSSSKELEADHSSVISCSTSVPSSYIPSSQESSSAVALSTGDFSDPREDFEDEREERTNIKTTNEREVESGSSDQSPEKHQGGRYMPGKRGANPSLRPHMLRGGPFHGHRPLLRFPPHGQYPPTQQQLNPYAPHVIVGPGGAPMPQQPQNLTIQNSIHPHHHDPMNPNHAQRPRHPFPGFRPGAPMNYRHPNQGGIYPHGPLDYGNPGGPPGFNPNFGHPQRLPFRPDVAGGPGMPPGMRPGMRMQRPPLQNLPPHNMAPNYPNGPPLRHQQPLQPLPSQMQLPQGAPRMSAPTVSAPAGAPSASSAVPTPIGLVPAAINVPQNSALRTAKVLINPNFKGGVEAATNKFIKETHFMNTISSHVSHLQSDDELLRQQEEFINKNRQHIEKRRNERVSPLPVRRSRSRSRTPRSRSRERSYSPKRSGGGNHADQRDRERNERLDRGAAGSSDRYAERYSGNRANRFRRGNSREREYENRAERAANYNKRRRSISPYPNSRGGSGAGGSARRGGDREKNDVEEDEETRVYRLEIEKQKALREKILRDKEMKRRRAAEEKHHEEKRTTNISATNSNNSNNGKGPSDELPQNQQPQKLKPIIVTERKIISLKKRQGDSEDSVAERRISQAPQRKLPTAKILPEAKRTLTDHLNHVSGSSSSGSHANTAIIKPVPKKETNTPPPPQPSVLKHTRRLSTPSDDEVELDYDEDEFMLEDEDRLLATPTPSPKRERSRTPTPDLPTKVIMGHSRSGNMKSSGAAPVVFTSSNRRVVLKSSTTSNSRRDSEFEVSSKSRRGGVGSQDDHSSASNSRGSNSSSRKVIFDRMDARKQLMAGSGSSSSDNKRRGQR